MTEKKIKKEDTKESTETKYVKKEDVKDDEASDKKDRKYYKVWF